MSSFCDILTEKLTVPHLLRLPRQNLPTHNRAMGSYSLHINRGQSHLKWSKSIELTQTCVDEDVRKFDINVADPVYGPVYVNGANTGDVLKVEILDLKTAEWRWTAIMPGFGLLSDEFLEPRLNIWHLPDDKPYARFKAGIRIPLRPFLGEMGVAPEAEGEFSTVPPLNTGKHRLSAPHCWFKALPNCQDAGCPCLAAAMAMLHKGLEKYAV